jgi:hypothetical protein
MNFNGVSLFSAEVGRFHWKMGDRIRNVFRLAAFEARCSNDRVR